MDEAAAANVKATLGHGTVVNDRYEIRQSLGKGGMGEVFLAYDRSTQETVALKIVREEARMPAIHAREPMIEPQQERLRDAARLLERAFPHIGRVG